MPYNENLRAYYLMKTNNELNCFKFKLFRKNWFSNKIKSSWDKKNK